MKEAFVALLVMLPFMFLIAWMWGYCLGYRDAKIEDRKTKANRGSIERLSLSATDNVIRYYDRHGKLIREVPK